MSFVVSVPADDASPAGAKVKCGPFWPDIDLNDAREVMKISGGTVTDPRLVAAIEGALLTALKDLTEWQAAQETAGYTKLQDIPAQKLGGESRLLIAWKRAIYAYATADLNETGRDLTATKAGADRAEDAASLADAFRRNGLFAVRDILGRHRVTSELI